MADNDLKERVKEYYHGNRISMAHLSEQSRRIFNTFVSVDQMKHWSSEDGGWTKAPMEDDKKLKIIAEKIFETIEDTVNISARDLVALANTYLSFATKMPPDQLGDSRPTIQQIIDIAGKVDNGKLE